MHVDMSICVCICACVCMMKFIRHLNICKLLLWITGLNNFSIKIPRMVLIFSVKQHFPVLIVFFFFSSLVSVFPLKKEILNNKICISQEKQCDGKSWLFKAVCLLGPRMSCQVAQEQEGAMSAQLTRSKDLVNWALQETEKQRWYRLLLCHILCLALFPNSFEVVLFHVLTEVETDGNSLKFSLICLKFLVSIPARLPSRYENRKNQIQTEH